MAGSDTPEGSDGPPPDDSEGKSGGPSGDQGFDEVIGSVVDARLAKMMQEDLPKVLDSVIAQVRDQVVAVIDVNAIATAAANMAVQAIGQNAAQPVPGQAGAAAAPIAGVANVVQPVAPTGGQQIMGNLNRAQILETLLDKGLSIWDRLQERGKPDPLTQMRALLHQHPETASLLQTNPLGPQIPSMLHEAYMLGMRAKVGQGGGADGPNPTEPLGERWDASGKGGPEGQPQTIDEIPVAELSNALVRRVLSEDSELEHEPRVTMAGLQV